MLSSLFLSLCLSLPLSTPPHSFFLCLSLPLPPPLWYWKGLGQITKMAIFIYEVKAQIDTYFMPSKSTLYYCCRHDLFILLKTPCRCLSVKGKRSGRDSPWTSIILDFSTGWSSMQRGHFPCTKIKIITMIKQTWGPACSSVKSSRFYTTRNGVNTDTKSLHCAVYKVEVWKSNYTTSRLVSGIVRNYECIFAAPGPKVR